MNTTVLLRFVRRHGGFLAASIAQSAPLIVAAQIKNPIGCDTIDACILLVVNYVLGLAGVLALASIVYGGFLYITAAGNQDRIEAGKNAVYYSIIGLLVIGLSYAILRFIFSALGGGGGPGGGGGNV